MARAAENAAERADGAAAWVGALHKNTANFFKQWRAWRFDGVSRVWLMVILPPEGLRNNNPGNIEAGSNPWEGQTGSDGRFATFATPEHGIRALGKNLLSYQRQGYDTVSEIVNRWAPASDGNNTDAYIKALCSALGVVQMTRLMCPIPKPLQLCVPDC
jgi:hypothetical protein